jgi:hypothetical protein
MANGNTIPGPKEGAGVGLAATTLAGCTGGSIADKGILAAAVVLTVGAALTLTRLAACFKLVAWTAGCTPDGLAAGVHAISATLSTCTVALRAESGVAGGDVRGETKEDGFCAAAGVDVGRAHAPADDGGNNPLL